MEHEVLSPHQTVSARYLNGSRVLWQASSKENGSLMWDTPMQYPEALGIELHRPF